MSTQFVLGLLTGTTSSFVLFHNIRNRRHLVDLADEKKLDEFTTMMKYQKVLTNNINN